MYVRVRSEIITLGRELSVPVEERAGVSLSPAQWKEMMESEDAVIVDGRNNYESDLGRFQGAICPPVESFREFPEWLEANRHLLVGKKVLTYCTGGIRCEKLTAWMLEAGFSDVYQLHGGIVAYGHDPSTSGEGFEGVNVVFDDRVTMPVGTKSQVITTCRECGQTTANYVNCDNVECNRRIILCPECEVSVGLSCSEECRSATRRRLKNKKLHESLGNPQRASGKPRRRGRSPQISVG
jgi:UPF0176 protein